jgi:hypothetical protein
MTKAQKEGLDDDEKPKDPNAPAPTTTTGTTSTTGGTVTGTNTGATGSTSGTATGTTQTSNDDSDKKFDDSFPPPQEFCNACWPGCLTCNGPRDGDCIDCKTTFTKTGTHCVCPTTQFYNIPTESCEDKDQSKIGQWMDFKE